MPGSPCLSKNKANQVCDSFFTDQRIPAAARAPRWHATIYYIILICTSVMHDSDPSVIPIPVPIPGELKTLIPTPILIPTSFQLIPFRFQPKIIDSDSSSDSGR